MYIVQLCPSHFQVGKTSLGLIIFSASTKIISVGFWGFKRSVVVIIESITKGTRYVGQEQEQDARRADLTGTRGAGRVL